MPPTLQRETFKSRVGEYYLGRTIGEVNHSKGLTTCASNGSLPRWFLPPYYHSLRVINLNGSVCGRL